MHRKLLPMALLKTCEGAEIEGRTRLQKLVFLLEQQMGDELESILNSRDYGFIAYDYGPFSKELYDDLESLHDAGLIEVTEEDMDDDKVKYTYQITEEGQNWVEDQLAKQDARVAHSRAESIKSEFNDMLLSELIDEVYTEYPEYARNSVW